MNKNQWLNKVNGDYLLSQPKNSVQVMALYAAHKPETEKELVSLIDSHYKTMRWCCKKYADITIWQSGKKAYFC